MRISSNEGWDEVGKAIQLAITTLMSTKPTSENQDDLHGAIECLINAQKHLNNLGLYSKGLDLKVYFY